MEYFNRTLALILCVQLFFFGEIVLAGPAPLISTSVAQVDKHIVTSREVKISFAIDQVFNKSFNFVIPEVHTDVFYALVNKHVTEWSVYLEALSLQEIKPDSVELQKWVQKVETQLKKNKSWQELQVSQAELKEFLTQKLMSQKMIRFREQSYVTPISELDVQKYYETFKKNFAKMSLDKAKEDIKKILTNQQIQKRVQDWYEVLRAKYQARQNPNEKTSEKNNKK
ncbi:MAG: hypothetical protein K1X29_03415 [Bdellovibrionales bacterium]|nr:hypothetical protein [Bdellovibrionales bacterium]